jgi:cobalt-zinc-cadmium efflux system protein
MKPSHEHPHSDTESLLKTGIFLSLAIFLLELFGGLWTHSLALLSDAWHIFIDIWFIVLSFLALFLARQPVSDRRTYGLHRMEVLAALLNGLGVFGIAIFILYAAIQRYHNPSEVHGLPLVGIASVGLVLNLIAAGLFYRKSEHDMNLRGVFLHLVGDALGTVAVILSGAVIVFTGWHQIDPIVSGLIAGMVLYGAGRLLRDSFETLLESVPRGISVSAVEAEMKSVQGVVSVHDLHVWSICSHLKALSGHVLLAPGDMGRQGAVLEGINRGLKERFGITHSTIQVESKAWPEGAIGETGTV